MELKEFCRSIQVSDKELFSELNELEESYTMPSKQEVRLIYSDRLLPPLPQPRAQILRLDSGKPSLSDSEEPYLVEVLHRPITIHKAPKEPSTPKPMFESDRKFEKLAIQPTSNMRASDTASHGNVSWTLIKHLHTATIHVIFLMLRLKIAHMLWLSATKQRTQKNLVLGLWKTMILS